MVCIVWYIHGTVACCLCFVHNNLFFCFILYVSQSFSFPNTHTHTHTVIREWSRCGCSMNIIQFFLHRHAFIILSVCVCICISICNWGSHILMYWVLCLPPLCYAMLCHYDSQYSHGYSSTREFLLAIILCVHVWWLLNCAIKFASVDAIVVFSLFSVSAHIFLLINHIHIIISVFFISQGILLLFNFFQSIRHLTDISCIDPSIEIIFFTVLSFPLALVRSIVRFNFHSIEFSHYKMLLFILLLLFFLLIIIITITALVHRIKRWKNHIL